MRTIVSTFAVTKCTLVIACIVVALSAASEAQRLKAHPSAQQSSSCPVPEKPAPSGSSIPPGGCVYAGLSYSNGATIPNGQTCKSGQWK